MKVSELIAQLQGMDQDADVAFCWGYGDYVGSTVAAVVTDVDRAPIYWSEYHRSMRLVDPEYRDDYTEDEQARHVVLVHAGADPDLLEEDGELS